MLQAGDEAVVVGPAFVDDLRRAGTAAAAGVEVTLHGVDLHERTAGSSICCGGAGRSGGTGLRGRGAGLHDAGTAGAAGSPDARDEVDRVERDSERHALSLRADVVQLHLPV